MYHREQQIIIFYTCENLALCCRLQKQYIERSDCFLLQPIRAPANCNCRDSMTDLALVGRANFMHAPPILFQPHLPSLLTLYTSGLPYSLFTPLSCEVFTIGRLMLILNELLPEYEKVSSLSQGCDEMSPLVEEYTSIPFRTPSLTDVTSASTHQRLPGSSSMANPSTSTANSSLVTQSR